MGHIEDIEESKMPSSNTAPAIMFGLTVVFLVFGVNWGGMDVFIWPPIKEIKGLPNSFG